MNKAGRPADPRRKKYLSHLSLVGAHKMPRSFFDQLDACKDDCARRLLLGISTHGETGWNGLPCANDWRKGLEGKNATAA